MSLEILMFLMYLLAAVLYGGAIRLLVMMGAHRSILRGVRSVLRRLKRRRGESCKNILFLLLLTGSVVATTGVCRADGTAAKHDLFLQSPAGSVNLKMDGMEDSMTGLRYVREDNCGVQCFFTANVDAVCELWIDGKDQRVAWAEVKAPVVAEETGLINAETMSAGAEEFPDINQAIPDFPGMIGTSMEGNVLLEPSDITGFLTDGQHEIRATVSSGEVILAETSTTFVLDTTAPLARVTLKTAAKKSDPDQMDGRCYLNDDFTVKVEVSEANPGSGRITLRRDFASYDQRDYSRAVINTQGPDQFGENGTFTDTVDTDGVYQYVLTGSDLAGNRLICEAEPYFMRDGTGCLIVRDTKSPKGRITVTTGQKNLFSMNERGYSEGTTVFPGDSEVRAYVSVDAEETLPVRIRGTLFMPNGSKSDLQSGGAAIRPDGYSFGASLFFKPEQNEAFFLKDLVMEDLAGNVTTFPRTPSFSPGYSSVNRAERDGTTKGSDGSGTGGRQENSASSSDIKRPDSEKEGPGSTVSRDETGRAADSDIPYIFVNFDNNDARNESYFRKPRTATVRVLKETFRADRVHISADGGKVSSSWDEEGDYRIKQIRFTEDGRCSLNVFATDAYGNPVSAQEIKGKASENFVIDTKQPEIEVNGVRDGSANARSPKIRVILSDDWADGCEILFRLREGEGKEKEVEAEEETVSETESLSADEKVRSGKNEAGGRKTSRKKEGEGVRLTGRRHFRISVPDRDAFYRLSCQAVDPAGNRSVRKISFSVNRTGTVFEVLPSPLDGTARNTLVVPEIRLHDLDDVVVVSASVNGRETKVTRKGQSVFFDHLSSQDGTYEIQLVTRDSSGHVSRMTPISFRIDRTPPLIKLALAEEKDVFIRSADVLVIMDEEEDEIESLTLNGKKLSAEAIRLEEGVRHVTVKGAGTHTITAQARDEAGNRSRVASCTVRIVHHLFESPFGRYGWRLILMGGVALAAGGAVLRRKWKKNSKEVSS